MPKMASWKKLVIVAVCCLLVAGMCAEGKKRKKSTSDANTVTHKARVFLMSKPGFEATCMATMGVYGGERNVTKREQNTSPLMLLGC
jgi:hypothetical protein